MASRTGKDVAILLIGGRDVRPFMNAIPTFNKDGTVEDTTPFGVEDQEQSYGGVRKFAFGISGFYDDTGSAAAAEASLGTVLPVCVGIAGNALGRPFTGFIGLENTYNRSAKVGGFTRIAMNFIHTTNSMVDEGVIVQPLGAVVADGHSATYDQGAASTRGLVAHLQAVGLTLGTATNLAVKVRDSADNVTFADLTGGAFAVLTAAPHAQRLVVTGTIRRYVRFEWAWTGGVGGGSTATIFGGVAIGTAVTGPLFLPEFGDGAPPLAGGPVELDGETATTVDLRPAAEEHAHAG